MSEHLKVIGQIRREDVPPKAAGAIASFLLLGGEGQDTTTVIKGALYPGWQRYQGREDLSPDLLPRYWVHCETPLQAHLANLLKPDNAHVEIVLTQQPQVKEVQTAHPFLEKLRNFASNHAPEIALSGIVASIYGATILSGNAFLGAAFRGLIYQDSTKMNEAMLQNYVGFGLILAGAATAAVIGAIQRRR